MKKLLDLAHAKLVSILGGHEVGINIHACQPNLEMAIYVLKSALCQLHIMTTVGGTMYNKSQQYADYHISAKKFIHKCQQGWVGRWSIIGKILST